MSCCRSASLVGDKCDFAGNDMISALHTFPPLVPVYSQSYQEVLFASAMRLQSHRHTQAVDSMTGTGNFGTCPKLTLLSSTVSAEHSISAGYFECTAIQYYEHRGCSKLPPVVVSYCQHLFD